MTHEDTKCTKHHEVWYNLFFAISVFFVTS